MKLFERSKWPLIAILICTAACDRTDELVHNGADGGKSRLIGANASAQQIVDECKQAYQRLTSYEDQAYARLAYIANGTPTEDRAPLSVAFERPGTLGLRVYAVEAGPSDGRWFLRLTDSEQSSVAGQVISRAVPPKADFNWLLSDPVIGEELAAGLAGFPPQLDMLLSTDAMRGLVDESSMLTLESAETIDGMPCYVVQVTRGQAEYRLWVDKSTMLLRRLQMPNANLTAEMLADKNISNVQLTIEFAGVSTNSKVNWSQYQVAKNSETKFVTRFVPAPPPLPTNRIGVKVPAFRLHDYDGAEAFNSSQVSENNVTVMMWLADHPACRAAAQQISQVAKSIAATDASQNIKFVSIWAEPNSAEGTTFATLASAWQLPGKLVVDKSAVGRDLFGVNEAPTLIVLDSSNRMQIFEERSNPYLVQLLPDLLNRIASGENLADEVVRTATLEQKRHRAELEMSAAINANRNLFTPVESYPPRLVELTELPNERPPTLKSTNYTAMNIDSAFLCWTLTSDGELRCEIPAGSLNQSESPSTVLPQSFQTQWQIDPQKRSRLEISPEGHFVAFTQQPSNSIELYDTLAKQSRNIKLESNQQIIDLQWLSLAGDKSPRLAVLTSGNETKLLDPKNQEQLSGRCPSEPMAIVPTNISDTLIGGYVVLADRGVEQLLLSGDSAFRNKPLLARPAGHTREISESASDLSSGANSGLLRKVAFQPATGPWRTIQFQLAGESKKTTSILARGWIAQDEPGVFLLDENLQQQWHYRLPITANKDAWLITSACVDPASGQPIWVVSQSDATIHLLRGDGVITDNFRLDDPVLGLGLVPSGERLLLFVAHANGIKQFSVSALK